MIIGLFLLFISAIVLYVIGDRMDKRTRARWDRELRWHAYAREYHRQYGVWPVDPEWPQWPPDFDKKKPK